MMSRGSVIPLFVEQIRAGQPMTVTDPKMTRFLMSLDDAVLLVEHAFEHARPGDLFIRKAPASTVGDLARAVGKAMGVEPDIKVIGTRHGEKLYETLATREELARAEDQGDYFRVAVDARDLNYSEYFDEGDVARVGDRRLPLAQHRAPRRGPGGGAVTQAAGLPEAGWVRTVNASWISLAPPVVPTVPAHAGRRRG